jgi:glycosyltransferase involved in cell wall biosynthesis
MSRRVLVVSYLFPPLGGIGVQRTLKYVKYLRRWGWEPIVITPANPAYTFRDDSLLATLPPDLEIHRTASFEPGRLPNAVARRLGRSVDGATPADGAPGGPTAPGSPARRPSRAGGLVWKSMILWNRIWGKLLFPDATVGWVPFAVRSGTAVARRSGADAVYSSSPSITCHMAAARIASRSGLPWVADFRDPWIGNAFSAPLKGVSGWRQRRIEKNVVARADRLVFATAGVMEGYAARYPWAVARMSVIPNGYDRADFAAPAVVATPAPTRGRFRLVYAGSLYGERELEIFLEGLALAIEADAKLSDRLAVDFVGWLNAHNREVAARATKSDALGRIVGFRGFLPHAEMAQLTGAADALLQIVADDPRKSQIHGGKLMEYLGQDKQILAVVPKGVARDLLTELKWGIVADPTPEGVADGLRRLLSEPPPKGKADPEGRYDRVNLAGELARVLDAAARNTAG